MQKVHIKSSSFTPDGQMQWYMSPAILATEVSATQGAEAGGLF